MPVVFAWGFLFSMLEEKKLEDIIWEMTKDELCTFDFPDIIYQHTKKFRQLKIGAYGIADLVYYKKPNNDSGLLKHKVTIVELKKSKIDVTALLQGLRYIAGVKDYFHEKEKNVEVQLVLIGSGVHTNFQLEASALDVLSDNIHILHYDVSLYGIDFTPIQSWSLINNGFNE